MPCDVYFDHFAMKSLAAAHCTIKVSECTGGIKCGDEITSNQKMKRELALNQLSMRPAHDFQSLNNMSRPRPVSISGISSNNFFPAQSI